MGIEHDDVLMGLNNDITSNRLASNKKVTGYLLFCSFVVCLASFQFGYNIGSVNSITPLVRSSFEKAYFKTIFFDKLDEFKAGEEKLANGSAKYAAGLVVFEEKKLYLEKKEKELLAAEARRDNYLDVMFSFDEEKIRQAKEFKAKKEKEIREKYNLSVEEFLTVARKKINEGKIKLAEGRTKLADAKIKIANGTAKLDFFRPKIVEGRKKIDIVSDIMWSFFNVLFIVGGMIGSFTSKSVIDKFGNKNGIIFHYLFTVIGTSMTVIPSYTNSPKLAALFIKIGRLFYGIQGGMACTLVQSYLHEISPVGLRGSLSVLHSIALALGLLVAQILGLEQILGNEKFWIILLGIPIIPAIISAILLITALPESPKHLIDTEKENQAVQVLKKLRASANVTEEIRLLYNELDEPCDKIRFQDIFRNKRIKWPVVCGVVLQIAQQVSGISVIFFYSQILFEAAGVPNDCIQYAICLTGFINLVATLIFLPTMKMFCRKKMLAGTLILMIIDLICLVVFIKFQKESYYFIYLSVASVMVLLVLFSAGLGPVPFLMIDETFEKDARSAPMFVCIVTNWTAALVVVLDFPFLIKLLGGYTFTISAGFLVIALFLVLFKMPETKGKSPAQIQNEFN